YSSPQLTPLSTSHSLSAPPSDESVELGGCLMYLMTCTRPDLAYPLSLMARYVAPGRHRKVHWDAAKRVLRYLCSTSGMGLLLGGRGPVVLTGHADASWVDDSATKRSSQGYTFSLGSGSVSWRSTRLSSVLSSSCEAEIYAGAMAAQELHWLTYLLTELGEQPRSHPVLYVDNKAMISLCHEHRLEHRTKHIPLRYFFARELQQRGQLRLAYVATRANTADVFTKALPPGASLLEKLNSDQISNLATDLRDYVAPLPDLCQPLVATDTQLRTLTKRFLPFLVQSTKISLAKLSSAAGSASSKSDTQTSQGAPLNPGLRQLRERVYVWLDIARVSIHAFHILRNALTSSTQYQNERNRNVLVHRLLTLKFSQDGAEEGWTLLQSVACILQGNTSFRLSLGDPPSSHGQRKPRWTTIDDVSVHDSDAVLALRSPTQEDTDELKTLVVGASVNSISCIADIVTAGAAAVSSAAVNADSKDATRRATLWLKRLPDLVAKLTPWLRALDADARIRNGQILVRALSQLLTALLPHGKALGVTSSHVMQLVTLLVQSGVEWCDARRLIAFLIKIAASAVEKGHEAMARALWEQALTTLMQPASKTLKSGNPPVCPLVVVRACVVASYTSHSVDHGASGHAHQFLQQQLSQAKPGSAVASIWAAVCAALHLATTYSIKRDSSNNAKPPQGSSDKSKGRSGENTEEQAEKIVGAVQTAVAGIKAQLARLGKAGDAGKRESEEGSEKERAVALCHVLECVESMVSAFAQQQWQEEMARHVKAGTGGTCSRKGSQVERLWACLQDLLLCVVPASAAFHSSLAAYRLALLSPPAEKSAAAQQLKKLLVEGQSGVVEERDREWMQCVVYNMGVNFYNASRYTEAVEPLALIFAAIKASPLKPRPELQEREKEKEKVLQQCVRCNLLTLSLRRTGQLEQAQQVLEEGLRRWGEERVGREGEQEGEGQLEGPALLAQQWGKVQASRMEAGEAHVPLHAIEGITSDPVALEGLMMQELSAYEEYGQQQQRCLAARTDVLHYLTTHVLAHRPHTALHRAAALLEHARCLRLLSSARNAAAPAVPAAGSGVVEGQGGVGKDGESVTESRIWDGLNTAVDVMVRGWPLCVFKSFRYKLPPALFLSPIPSHVLRSPSLCGSVLPQESELQKRSSALCGNSKGKDPLTLLSNWVRLREKKEQKGGTGGAGSASTGAGGEGVRAVLEVLRCCAAALSVRGMFTYEMQPSNQQAAWEDLTRTLELWSMALRLSPLPWPASFLSRASECQLLASVMDLLSLQASSHHLMARHLALRLACSRRPASASAMGEPGQEQESAEWEDRAEVYYRLFGNARPSHMLCTLALPSDLPAGPSLHGAASGSSDDPDCTGKGCGNKGMGEEMWGPGSGEWSLLRAAVALHGGCDEGEQVEQQLSSMLKNQGDEVSVGSISAMPWCSALVPLACCKGRSVSVGVFVHSLHVASRRAALTFHTVTRIHPRIHISKPPSLPLPLPPSLSPSPPPSLPPPSLSPFPLSNPSIHPSCAAPFHAIPSLRQEPKTVKVIAFQSGLHFLLAHHLMARGLATKAFHHATEAYRWRLAAFSHVFTPSSREAITAATDAAMPAHSAATSAAPAASAPGNGAPGAGAGAGAGSSGTFLTAASSDASLVTYVTAHEGSFVSAATATTTTTGLTGAGGVGGDCPKQEAQGGKKHVPGLQHSMREGEHLVATHEATRDMWPAVVGGGAGRQADVVGSGVPSPWRLVADYVDSLHQLGSVFEHLGMTDEAERRFTEGLHIARALALPHAQGIFSSYLGGSIGTNQSLRSMNWHKAEQHLAHAAALLRAAPTHPSHAHPLAEATCRGCAAIAESNLQQRLGDLARRRDDLECSGVQGVKGGRENAEEEEEEEVSSAIRPSRRGEGVGEKRGKNGGDDRGSGNGWEVAVEHYSRAEKVVGQLVPWYGEVRRAFEGQVEGLMGEGWEGSDGLQEEEDEERGGCYGGAGEDLGEAQEEEKGDVLPCKLLQRFEVEAKEEEGCCGSERLEGGEGGSVEKVGAGDGYDAAGEEDEEMNAGKGKGGKGKATGKAKAKAPGRKALGEIKMNGVKADGTKKAGQEVDGSSGTPAYEKAQGKAPGKVRARGKAGGSESERGDGEYEEGKGHGTRSKTVGMGRRGSRASGTSGGGCNNLSVKAGNKAAAVDEEDDDVVELIESDSDEDKSAVQEDAGVKPARRNSRQGVKAGAGRRQTNAAADGSEAEETGLKPGGRRLAGRGTQAKKRESAANTVDVDGSSFSTITMAAPTGGPQRKVKDPVEVVSLLSDDSSRDASDGEAEKGNSHDVSSKKSTVVLRTAKKTTQKAAAAARGVRRRVGAKAEKKQKEEEEEAEGEEEDDMAGLFGSCQKRIPKRSVRTPASRARRRQVVEDEESSGGVEEFFSPVEIARASVGKMGHSQWQEREEQGEEREQGWLQDVQVCCQQQASSPLVRAALLLNVGRLSLLLLNRQHRGGDAGVGRWEGLNVGTVTHWLLHAAALSSEAPLLFRKVAHLIATTCATPLTTTQRNHDPSHPLSLAHHISHLRALCSSPCHSAASAASVPAARGGGGAAGAAGGACVCDPALLGALFHAAAVGATSRMQHAAQLMAQQGRQGEGKAVTSREADGRLEGRHVVQEKMMDALRLPVCAHPRHLASSLRAFHEHISRLPSSFPVIHLSALEGAPYAHGGMVPAFQGQAGCKGVGNGRVRKEASCLLLTRVAAGALPLLLLVPCTAAAGAAVGAGAGRGAVGGSGGGFSGGVVAAGGAGQAGLGGGNVWEDGGEERCVEEGQGSANGPSKKGVKGRGKGKAGSKEAATAGRSKDAGKKAAGKANAKAAVVKGKVGKGKKGKLVDEVSSRSSSPCSSPVSAASSCESESSCVRDRPTRHDPTAQHRTAAAVAAAAAAAAAVVAGRVTDGGREGSTPADTAAHQEGRREREEQRGRQKVQWSEGPMHQTRREFEAIMKESSASMAAGASAASKESKAAWWKWRLTLDERLQVMLRGMERQLLGPWAFLLLGQPSEGDAVDAADGGSVAGDLLLAAGRELAQVAGDKAGVGRGGEGWGVVAGCERVSGATECSCDDPVCSLVAAQQSLQLQRAAFLIHLLFHAASAAGTTHKAPKTVAGTPAATSLAASAAASAGPSPVSFSFEELAATAHQALSALPLLEGGGGHMCARAAAAVEAQGEKMRQIIDRALQGAAEASAAAAAPAAAGGGKGGGAGGGAAVRRGSNGNGGRGSKKVEVQLKEMGGGKRMVQWQPVQLILDSAMQALPWEGLPCLAQQRIYRLPSFTALLSLLTHYQHHQTSQTQQHGRVKGRKQGGGAGGSGKAGQGAEGQVRVSVDARSAFYLLNPSGDLKSTQGTFEAWFKQQRTWKGKVCEAPSEEEFMKALEQYSLFVYCGHGSGEQYLHRSYLKKLSRCALSLLMGCSSARLSPRGDYEPLGVPLNYLAAGCPAIVGNLWDVTDGDIDRYSQRILESWVGKSRAVGCGSGVGEREKRGGGSCECEKVELCEEGVGGGGERGDSVLVLPECKCVCVGGTVAEARSVCRLRHLIGLAPVCYGVPCSLQPAEPT
ncbi:unnamed protein product, partial [Closterium sp. NIES-53]